MATRSALIALSSDRRSLGMNNRGVVGRRARRVVHRVCLRDFSV
jgi:hypothetical protein